MRRDAGRRQHQTRSVVLRPPHFRGRPGAGRRGLGVSGRCWNLRKLRCASGLLGRSGCVRARAGRRPLPPPAARVPSVRLGFTPVAFTQRPPRHSRRWCRERSRGRVQRGVQGCGGGRRPPGWGRGGEWGTSCHCPVNATDSTRGRTGRLSRIRGASRYADSPGTVTASASVKSPTL